MTLLRRLLVLTIGVLGAALGWAAEAAASSGQPDGAWQREGEPGYVLLVADGYFSQAIFDPAAKQFVRTFGGPYQVNGTVATGRLDFDSGDPQRVGERFQVQLRHDGNQMTIVLDDGTTERWSRLKSEPDALTGVWRITGRLVDGNMNELPLRPRRTLKILAGGRFQWVAMNVETGEFSGTGGGTYTFKDGKYVETIEFFSRDGSRVGAVLDFTGEVADGVWRHRGKSSRGDPIDEQWSRLEAAAR